MIEIVKFQNADLACNIETLNVDDHVWFRANDVAKTLGYFDVKTAIRDHVDSEYKSSRADLMVGAICHPPLNGNEKRTTWISEPGLYQLIFKSKMQQAKVFTKWVVEDVLPTIRKTGSYQAPKLLDKQISLMNEKDLHYKVVDFIKTKYPEITIIPGLGELQDTTPKRTDAFKKGYTGGQPDLIITNPSSKYNGFAIELKTPNGKGVLSEKQTCFMVDLLHCGYYCLVSNDYDEILIELIEYLRDVRFKCPFCCKKFKSTETLQTHHEVIHKIG